MKYIIKNIKFNNYYHSNICESYHFVLDRDDAYICQNKWEANRIVKQFKNADNYEIIKVRKDRRKK